MGNYALNVLLHQLDKLDYAYDKFVKNGDVDSENKVAKENREKAKDLNDAIKILNANADTGERQLTIPDVSGLLLFSEREKKDLKLLLDYFGRNDVSTFEHFAFGFIKGLLKRLEQ